MNSYKEYYRTYALLLFFPSLVRLRRARWEGRGEGDQENPDIKAFSPLPNPPQAEEGSKRVSPILNPLLRLRSDEV